MTAQQAIEFVEKCQYSVDTKQLALDLLDLVYDERIDALKTLADRTLELMRRT